MKYFNKKTYTAETLKKDKRKLAFSLHPDRGGSQADFIAMNKEYEEILHKIESGGFTNDNSDNSDNSYNSSDNIYNSYSSYKSHSSYNSKEANNSQTEDSYKSEDSKEEKTQQYKQSDIPIDTTETISVYNPFIDVIFIASALLGLFQHVFIWVVFIVSFILLKRFHWVKKYSIIGLYSVVLLIKNVVSTNINILSINMVDNLLIVWFAVLIVYYLYWALNSAWMDK